MDIAIPQNNEKEFLEIAARLLIPSLLFLYPSLIQLEQKKKEHPGWNAGLLSNNPSEIRKATQRGIFAATQSNELAVLDSSPQLVFGLESFSPKDSLHSRNSGLNHVLCPLMERKEISYGLSFSSLLLSTGRERALLLGRMRQNILLCRKFGIKATPYSFASTPYGLRSKKDLDSFFARF